jgi:hypothetical protein
MSSVNIVDKLMDRQRERCWKHTPFLRYCEEVFVKKMIDNRGHNVGQSLAVASCSGKCLSIAV